MMIIIPLRRLSHEIIRRLKWLVRVLYRNVILEEQNGKIIIRGQEEEVQRIQRIIDHYIEKEDVVEDEDLVYPEPGPLFREWELEEA